MSNITLDEAAEKFQANPTKTHAKQYLRTAKTYHADGMIGDLTLKTVQKEVQAYTKLSTTFGKNS